jgi:hypothetical protein
LEVCPKPGKKKIELESRSAANPTLHKVKPLSRGDLSFQPMKYQVPLGEEFV